MSNQDSRIRNRQLRAYGVFAIAAILLIIIIIAVVGLFSKDKPTDANTTPSGTTTNSSTAMLTPTPTPPVTPSAPVDPSGSAEPNPGPSNEKVVKTSSGSGVNMRAQASTDSSIVAHLDDGQVLTVISPGDEWTQVKTSDNKEGFVKNDFLIDKVTASVININSTLNVRETANANGNKIGSLEKGDVVIVLDSSGSEWTKIALSNGKIGYCKSEYLQISE